MKRSYRRPLVVLFEWKQMLRETPDAQIDAGTATRRARVISREIGFAVVLTAAAAMAGIIGASNRGDSETASIADDRFGGTRQPNNQ
jgi:hypothetical protein